MPVISAQKKTRQGDKGRPRPGSDTPFPSKTKPNKKEPKTNTTHKEFSINWRTSQDSSKFCSAIHIITKIQTYVSSQNSFLKKSKKAFQKKHSRISQTQKENGVLSRKRPPHDQRHGLWGA